MLFCYFTSTDVEINFSLMPHDYAKDEKLTIPLGEYPCLYDVVDKCHKKKNNTV